MIYADFEKLWESTLRGALTTLEDLRKREKKAILIGIGSAIGIGCILLGGGIALEWDDDLVFSVAFAAAFVLGFFIYSSNSPKDYKSRYKNEIITPLIAQTKYKWIISYTQNPSGTFVSSGLYRDNATSYDSNDAFEASMRPTFVMSEVDVSRGSGKNRVQIFKGLIFKADVGHAFVGETYARAEKQKRFSCPMGTARTRNLFSSKLEKTNLEWNDFEELIDIQTTDQQEAREIFDPAFMAILHDWWKTHGKNVRLSFLSNHMYLAMPFAQDMFEPNVFATVEQHKKTLWAYLDAFLLVENLLTSVEKKYRL